MKYALLICLLPFFASAQYQVAFHVNNLPPTPTTITLGYYFAGQSYRIDSTRIDAGQPVALLKGEQTLHPGLYFLSINHTELLDFVLNEPELSFSTDFSAPFDSFQSLKSLENGPFWHWQRLVRDRKKRIEEAKTFMELLGKATNDPAALKEQTQLIAELENEIQQFSKAQASKYPGMFFPVLVAAGMQPEIPASIPPILAGQKINPKYGQYYRAHYWDDYDFKDERLWYSRVLPQKLNTWISLNAQPIDSTQKALDIVLKKASVYPKTQQLIQRLLLQQFENLNMINGDALLVYLFDHYYPNARSAGIDTATWMRIQYKAELFRPNLIGKKAPDFQLVDAKGQMVRLNDFKAKYTLLYFFSPLCTRCREFTPDIHGITKNYLDKGLRVLAVTTDCPDKNYWKTYVDQNLSDWTCLLESKGANSELERLYATAQLPNIYFLDEHKKIVLKRVPVERLQDFLDQWVK